MKSDLLKSVSLVLGTLSIALGVFNWLWIFYASDAAHHMGSPIRRFSKSYVQSLTGDHSYVAREAHGTGLVLIEVLGNTFWVVFASGIILVLTGCTLLYIAMRLNSRSAVAPPSSPNNSFKPKPLRGSA